MTKIIDDIILELEDYAEWHNRLAIMYEGQEDDSMVNGHYIAKHSYEMALQIVRKHHNQERMLKIAK
jgi:hypothetical protein